MAVFTSACKEGAVQDLFIVPFRAEREIDP